MAQEGPILSTAHYGPKFGPLMAQGGTYSIPPKIVSSLGPPWAHEVLNLSPFMMGPSLGSPWALEDTTLNISHDGPRSVLPMGKQHLRYMPMCYKTDG
jgi:hypothetical protein